MADINRQWIYSNPVTGKLQVENFSLQEAPMPVPQQGQTLVRNKLISLDPTNRGWFSGQSYRPQVHIGDVMGGFGIGEVVESTDYRFAPGDIIHADLGWQDYAVINSYERSEYVYKCTPGYTEEDLLGVFGITGLTAYVGIQEVGKLLAGQTVVVAGATGACGVIVGQLAKIAGCYVVGFGGGPEKCRWLTEEMGFDAAVDYKGDDIAAELATKCPDGVDFFSDAVGGVVTKATIPLMKKNAGWYHYGNISTYDDLVPGKKASGNNYMTPELKEICRERNLKPRFLLVFDFYCQRKRVEAELAAYMQDGKLKAPATILEGLEQLPAALVDGTMGGKRYGKLSVRVAH